MTALVPVAVPLVGEVIDPLPTFCDVLDTGRQPDGMAYYWVRELIGGKLDEANIRWQLSQGWTFVPCARHPEMRTGRQAPPGAHQDAVRDRIDMVLMERPKALAPVRKTSEQQVADILAANGLTNGFAEITSTTVGVTADGRAEVLHTDRITITGPDMPPEPRDGWRHVGGFRADGMSANQIADTAERLLEQHLAEDDASAPKQIGGTGA